MLLVIAAACPTLSHAQGDINAAVELPAVRIEASEYTQLQDSAVVIHVPVQVLGVSDVGELLSTLPGVQVRTAGGFGSYSEASLRGSSGRQVRVLLDGMPLDTGGGETTSLALVSPLLLEEVTVYKGRVPLDLVSGLAGTIDLRSRRELPSPVVGTATVGSFGQQQLDLAAQAGAALQFAGGLQGADNDFDYVNSYKPFDPSDPDRKRAEKRQNAGNEQAYGLFRYFGSQLEATAHVVKDLQEIPTRLNLTTTDAELETQSYALSLSRPATAPWQAALSHRFTREEYRDPSSQVGLGAQDTRSETKRSLLSASRRFYADRLQNSVSAEYTDYTASDHLGDVVTSSADRLILGAGLAAQSSGARRYNASLQLAWVRDTAPGESKERWQLEPAVGISQRFDACLTAANLGHRERLPTFFERYGDRGLFRGNPQLTPERAVYGDAGLRCQPGEHVQRLELTVFGQDLRDVISPTYNAQGVGRSVNTERALIYGVEAESAGSLVGVGWRLSGTWQHTEDRTDVQAARGQQLPGRFETQLGVRLEKRLFGVIAYYAYRYEAGQHYDVANLLKAPDLQRHDLGLRGAYRKTGWSLQGIDLSDEQSEQFNGYPTPGRRVMFSITYPAIEPSFSSTTDSPESVDNPKE